MTASIALTIEPSTGNVYADLGNTDADAMLFKARLTRRIAAIIANRKLTRQEAANIAGVSKTQLDRKSTRLNSSHQ